MNKIKSFYEYSALSSRTANDIICNTKEKQLMHYALGLLGEFAGEVNELLQEPINNSKLSKELGDCFWYFSQLISELEVELSPTKLDDIDNYMLVTFNRSLDSLHKDTLVAIAKLTEYVKKVCCFNHPRNPINENLLCKQVFLRFLNFVMASGLLPSQVMYENIEKLKARYPDGFSTEKSVNRKN